MHTTASKTGWLVILLILWGGYPAVAQLYQWTNADGVRHFSNTPPPDGVKATVVQDEIPYDPETDHQRRAQEDTMLQERESAASQRRLENAERDAANANRKADQLEKELEDAQEDQDEDRSYGVYTSRRRPDKDHRPGHRPPGQRPPNLLPKPKPHTPTAKPPRPNNSGGSSERGKGRSAGRGAGR